SLYTSLCHPLTLFFFFFTDTAPTHIYTLSLHDVFRSPSVEETGNFQCVAQAPTVESLGSHCFCASRIESPVFPAPLSPTRRTLRSEEHTSELQSRSDLVCRLLLEKKKHQPAMITPTQA